MKLETITWNDARPIDEIVTLAQQRSVDYLLVRPKEYAGNAELTVPATNATDLIVYRDARQTEFWRRLSQVLPVELYLLAAKSFEHAGIAISISAAVKSDETRKSKTISEFVTQMARSATVSFVDDCPTDSISSLVFPALTIAEGSPGPAWVHGMIWQLAATGAAASTALTSLKAGLFLINDFFDDSHHASQSIEGIGWFHSGDYWHAILHRREPDYGNAKYWFRHVGRHPIFRELAEIVQRRLNVDEGSLANKLQPWKSRLIARDGWDPFTFVDLCSAAQNDPALKAWCELVQYDEMTLLLGLTALELREITANI